MKYFSAFIFLSTLAACASAPKLEQVPIVDVNTLPLITSSRIKPKAMMIEVVNLRQVNQKAGNSEQVATAVSDALTQVVQKSGFSLGKTTNLMRVELVDCPSMKNPEGEEISGSVCLKIKVKLITAAFTYEGSATSQNYMQRGSYAWTQYGDVDEAYQSALQTLINGINSKLSEEKP